MKKIKSLLTVLTLLAFPFGVGAITTDTYEIDPSSNMFSVYHNIATDTYEIDGSIDPWAAYLTDGTNYDLESGDAFRWYCGDGFVDPNEECDNGEYGENLGDQSCQTLGHDDGDLACNADCTFDETDCSDDGGGGGGGGGGTVKSSAPVLDAEFTVEGYFTYDDTMLLYGTRSSGQTVRVNGSSTGVTYPTDTTWQATLSLSVGGNSFSLQSVSSSGQTSSSASYTIERHAAGDVNDDLVIDDYDLSLVVKYWGTNSYMADFNGDGIVDDYDFSILISQWA